MRDIKQLFKNMRDITEQRKKYNLSIVSSSELVCENCGCIFKTDTDYVICLSCLKKFNGDDNGDQTSS